MAKLIFTETKKQFIDNQTYELSEYIGEEVNIDEEAFSLLRYIEKQKIDEVGLEDFYLYDGIPMYFFARPTLFLKLKSVINCFSVMEEIKKRTSDKVYIETDSSAMALIGEKYFDCECTMIERQGKDAKINSRDLITKLSARLVRSLKAQIKFGKKKKLNRNLLVFSHAASLNLTKGHDGANCYSDTQVGPIMEALKEKYNILNLQFLNNNALLQRSIKYKGEYVAFEIFKLYKKALGKSVIKSELEKDRLSFINELDFTYHGFDLKLVFKNHVFYDVKGMYISYLKELLVAEKFLRRNKIDKCLIVGEGDRARCIVVAAKRLGIKTFAVQHGIINRTAPAYIINSSHGSLLVPDMTFVWGEKYKRILVNESSSYNDSNITVAGQVRTDSLVNREYEKHSSDKIRILYATQYFMDILKPATEILFKALERMNIDYELVIKLHPADVNYDFYKEMIKKYTIKNASIVTDTDLYDIINWSDIVVSVHSTVICEGALFNKPSICIILPKYNDAGGFVKEGISYSARDEYELCELLKRSKFVNTEYMESINRYVYENFYSIDGNVVKRIVNIIGE